MGEMISEHDFMQNEEQRLRTLSERMDRIIKDCEIDCATIARECGIDPRIARRARRGIPVRADTTARLELYLSIMEKQLKESMTTKLMP